MSDAPEGLEHRLRWAGLLTGAGLLVELASLAARGPSAFLAFLLLGAALIGGGVLLFLYSLVTLRS